MRDRLWVVECLAIYGRQKEWNVCDFADRPCVSTNYYNAHAYKRIIQEYLQKHGNKHWYKNRFRVTEYKSTKKK